MIVCVRKICLKNTGGVSLKDVALHVSLSERYGSVLLSMENRMAVFLSMENMNMMAVCLSAYE